MTNTYLATLGALLALATAAIPALIAWRYRHSRPTWWFRARLALRRYRADR